MSFSERYGYKPVREIIQIESMDEPLRNGIWSLLQMYFWDRWRGGCYISKDSNRELYVFCMRLWLSFFKKPLDQLDSDWRKVLNQLRNYYFGYEWNEVYDFIEFIAYEYPNDRLCKKFIEDCNNLFEKEMSGYRFVGNMITRITGEEEIQAIEQALESDIDTVSTHIRRSLELLSDRNSPDYRNSIKEAVSAVESLVAQVLDEKNGTLGQLLKKLETEIKLHPALTEAFSKLYGYTSDDGGIRHALMEKESHDFHDAKFMLVVCSTFINYVKAKVR